jgi:hypothetical protein
MARWARPRLSKGRGPSPSLAEGSGPPSSPRTPVKSRWWCGAGVSALVDAESAARHHDGPVRRGHTPLVAGDRRQRWEQVEVGAAPHDRGEEDAERGTRPPRDASPASRSPGRRAPPARRCCASSSVAPGKPPRTPGPERPRARRTASASVHLGDEIDRLWPRGPRSGARDGRPGAFPFTRGIRAIWGHPAGRGHAPVRRFARRETNAR